jgi:crossover junction endodeoxyribonuclease RuvC
MKVLGFDVGTTNLGLSVIESSNNKNKVLYHKYTYLKKDSFANKILFLENYFNSIIDEYKPEVISYEAPFIRSFNGQELIMVCGVLVLCAAKHSLKYVSYTPSAIKKAVYGKGKCSKEELESAVQKLLSTPVKFENDHVSDSVAIALTFILKK